ncbi:MAG: hypothetical protein ABR607_11750 [Pyrinomonadaceae bacterium]
MAIPTAQGSWELCWIENAMMKDEAKRMKTSNSKFVLLVYVSLTVNHSPGSGPTERQQMKFRIARVFCAVLIAFLIAASGSTAEIQKQPHQILAVHYVKQVPNYIVYNLTFLAVGRRTIHPDRLDADEDGTTSCGRRLSITTAGNTNSYSMLSRTTRP